MRFDTFIGNLYKENPDLTALFLVSSIDYSQKHEIYHFMNITKYSYETVNSNPKIDVFIPSFVTPSKISNMPDVLFVNIKNHKDTIWGQNKTKLFNPLGFGLIAAMAKQYGGKADILNIGCMNETVFNKQLNIQPIFDLSDEPNINEYIHNRVFIQDFSIFNEDREDWSEIYKLGIEFFIKIQNILIEKY